MTGKECLLRIAGNRATIPHCTLPAIVADAISPTWAGNSKKQGKSEQIRFGHGRKCLLRWQRGVQGESE